jgi:transglutaminase-like putative cysteine protease
VSRGSFRAQVEAPRPTSAWVLVTVASTTLWITQQLDAWAILIQAPVIGLSLWRRTRPFPWQQSAVLLNLGMIGIVAATTAVALRGEPSTIALAHFAALTQALQLLDARPRHTEFLLVTLALFQVILASNLTDSVFFPPLLMIFVCSTVWTLMVHTLRTEAIEAGDPRGVNRAITPGLLRITLAASGLAVLLALLLFVTLPRLRSSVIPGAGLGPALISSGFSDRVELGEIGRIRLDSQLVMRIETLEGRSSGAGEGYWRGLAFDHFDGRTWSITPAGRTPVAGSPEGGVTFGRTPDDFDLVQRIVREPVQAGVLFRAGELSQLQGTVRRLQRDSSGGLYAQGQADERIRYTTSTRVRNWSDVALRRDRTAPDRRHAGRNLQLPPLGAEVAALARRIVADHANDADRVRAVERHLVREGRYTNRPPRIEEGSDRSPVETFLLDGMAGHCEYFASSMVVLLRSLDIPARTVNGFAGGQRNQIGGFLEVSRSDAHSWVEVHYERAGWVRYDPTPPDLRARPAVALSLGERTRQLASALELWWFQRVVGFDRADQIHALKRAWLAWRETRENLARAEPSTDRARSTPGGWQEPLRRAGPWLAGGLLLALLVCWRRRESGGDHTLPPEYRSGLRLLARRGLVRSPTDTARDFARRVQDSESTAAAVAFDTLTESYLAERFGSRPAPPHDASLAALRTALKAHPGSPLRRERPRAIG